MIWYVSSSERKADSLEEVVELMKSAQRLGMGYRVVHDVSNNPNLIGISDDRQYPPRLYWHVDLFHYTMGPPPLESALVAEAS